MRHNRPFEHFLKAWRSLSCVAGCLLLTMTASGQSDFALKEQTLDNPDNEPVPVHPVPHERQLKWNETEFYAFFHYGMNTYTGLEWGNGDEDETIFAPTDAPDPKQWLQTVKDAGMKGGIAVVKHHDGFCLWPTASTTHNVERGGNDFARKTNIPRDFAKAAKELNMKYGFYVSPWDRNSVHYGKDTYVKEVFLRQCAELAQYGTDQFEMWFDGANGGSGYYGGQRGTRSIDPSTYYDIPNLRDSVHKVCPQCVMWGVGGEARWIGNEAGWAGETCWSMGTGTSGNENEWKWNPGESDAKATSGGWFWHSGETVLTTERLFQMYLETVGRNATLILNCPPDKSGRLPEATVQRLKDFGATLTQRLGTDLAPEATITASDVRLSGAKRTYAATNLTDNNTDTYWATDDLTEQATITLEWPTAKTLRYVSLMEYIRKGQRVRAFRIETSQDGNTWTRQGGSIATTTIGYKRIIPLNGSTSMSYGQGVSAKYLRIVIEDSKACPLLHTISVY